MEEEKPTKMYDCSNSWFYWKPKELGRFESSNHSNIVDLEKVTTAIEDIENQLQELHSLFNTIQAPKNQESMLKKFFGDDYKENEEENEEDEESPSNYFELTKL